MYLFIITSLKTSTIFLFQMRPCQNCNRECSDKNFRKHCRSNNHLKKRLELDIITKQKTYLLMKSITLFLT